jgi:hypothetical protein
MIPSLMTTGWMQLDGALDAWLNLWRLSFLPPQLPITCVVKAENKGGREKPNS